MVEQKPEKKLDPAPSPLWEKEWREYEERELGRPRQPLEAPKRPTRIIPPNQLNHQLNLFGGRGFDGLTGFYKGQFYFRGRPR